MLMPGNAALTGLAERGPTSSAQASLLRNTRSPVQLSGQSELTNERVDAAVWRAYGSLCVV